MRDIEEAEIEARKKYTKEQLRRRRFCTGCKDFVGKRSFLPKARSPYEYHAKCQKCRKKKAKAKALRDKLLANEIYAPGASKVIVEKVVAGRRLVTKMALAKFLNVTTKTIERMVHRGEIPSYDFLGQVFFKKEDVDAWLSKKLGEKIETEDKLLFEQR